MKLSRRALLALAAATSIIAAPHFAAAQDKGTVGIAMPTKSSSRWISDGESMVKQFTRSRT
jgi:putative multiple sugar transport system substrate-binding protein